MCDDNRRGSRCGGHFVRHAPNTAARHSDVALAHTLTHEIEVSAISSLPAERNHCRFPVLSGRRGRSLRSCCKIGCGASSATEATPPAPAPAPVPEEPPPLTGGPASDPPLAEPVVIAVSVDSDPKSTATAKKENPVEGKEGNPPPRPSPRPPLYVVREPEFEPLPKQPPLPEEVPTYAKVIFGPQPLQCDYKL